MSIGYFEIPPGAVASTALGASRDHAAILLTLIARGCVVFPLNPRFPAPRLGEAMKQAGSRTLIAEDGVAAPDDAEVIHPSQLGGWARLVPTLDGLAKLPAHAPAVLVLTSGSSGAPKAAALSLGNFSAAARLSARNLPLGPGDGWLLSLPLFHVAGLGILFRCLHSGAEAVYPAPGESLLQAIQRPEVTHVSLVATQLYRLLREPGGRDALRRLKAILCGGSAMPSALMEEAFEAGLPLHTSYGMTETSAQITATAPGEGIEAWRSSGRPLAEGCVRIAADGEICVRGETLFQGYWRAGRLERPLDREGWFHTGDLGALDSEGRLHVLGRIGNRFVSGGENVQPEEIERALLALPGVRRARVVPVADEEFVQAPAAFVEQDLPVALDALRNALRPALPPHSLPRHVFPWPDYLEREGEKLSQAALMAEANRLLR